MIDLKEVTMGEFCDKALLPILKQVDLGCCFLAISEHDDVITVFLNTGGGRYAIATINGE